MSLADIKNTKGRVLGVDYGEARTGLALSDLSRFLASGIGNIPGGGLEKSATLIVAAAREHGAVGVVIGWLAAILGAWLVLEGASWISQFSDIFVIRASIAAGSWLLLAVIDTRPSNG